MPIPLGILAVAGAVAPVAAGDYELITTTTLGTAAASVTFSNLGDYSSTYQHLQIRYTGRSTRTATSDILVARLNGVSTGSYSSHSLYGNGSSVISEGNANTSSIYVGRVASANAASNIFGAGIIDVLDAYETTKNKTLRSLAGEQDGGIPLGEAAITSGTYYSTNAVSSITLLAVNGNLVIGSRFSLYGVK